LLCDKAIVTTCPRGNEPVQAHATVHALEAGWSWRTEHQRFMMCGIAFSSRHLDAQQAEAQLRAMYPQCGPARLLNLAQGCRENAWSGNVIGVGTASGLVEPLAAAGPATSAFHGQWIARTLIDCDNIVRPSIIKQYNKRWRRILDSEREFLGLFYRFNTRFDTPFWQEARHSSHIGALEPVLRCYQDIGPDSLHRSMLLYENDPIGMEGYFSVLVGQKVPWSNPWKPSPQELAKWPSVAEHWRRVAANGLTSDQASQLLLGNAPAPQAQGSLRMPSDRVGAGV
jgi:tryptophan halogenase